MRQSLELAREIQEASLLHESTLALGRIRIRRDKIEEARAPLEEARDAGEPDVKARALEIAFG